MEESATKAWKACSRADILEAFAAHPKIGDPKITNKRGAEEQSGVRTSTAATLDELAKLNRDYEARFGYIYIVCATGRSGDEMLQLLARTPKERPPNRKLKLPPRSSSRLRCSG